MSHLCLVFNTNSRVAHLRLSGVMPPVCGLRYLAMNGTELPSAKRRQTAAAAAALPEGQSGASTADGVHENREDASSAPLPLP